MLPLLLYLTAVLHFSTCGSVQFCQGDNQCSHCTVTGPTVIDIHGQVNSVQDRCAYALMRTPLFPNLQVHATFQERRRKDVSFLDRVILSLENPRVDINLEQGGKVQIDQPVLIPKASNTIALSWPSAFDTNAQSTLSRRCTGLSINYNVNQSAATVNTQRKCCGDVS